MAERRREIAEPSFFYMKEKARDWNEQHRLDALSHTPGRSAPGRSVYRNRRQPVRG